MPSSSRCEEAEAVGVGSCPGPFDSEEVYGFVREPGSEQYHASSLGCRTDSQLRGVFMRRGALVLAAIAVVGCSDAARDTEDLEASVEVAETDSGEPLDLLSQLRAEFEELMEQGVDPEILGLPPDPTDEDFLALIPPGYESGDVPADADRGRTPAIDPASEEYYLMLGAWLTLDPADQAAVCVEVGRGMTEAVAAGRTVSDAAGALVTPAQAAAFLRTVC